MDGVEVVGLSHHLPREATCLLVKDTDLATDHGKLRRALLFRDQSLQFLQAAIGDFGIDRGLLGGGRSGAGGILEAERGTEAHGADQVHRVGEIGLALAGETHDEI